MQKVNNVPAEDCTVFSVYFRKVFEEISPYCAGIARFQGWPRQGVCNRKALQIETPFCRSTDADLTENRCKIPAPPPQLWRRNYEAFLLHAHLANEGSGSCSDQTEKGEKEKRAALKLYVQSAGQLSAHFIESIGKVYWKH